MKFVLSALLTLVLFTACQSTRPFSDPGSNWRTHQGQLRYSDSTRSLIGDVVIASVPPHDFQVDYVAGPGFPLLKIRLNETRALAEGVLVRGRWQGKPEAVPAKFETLFALAEVFHSIAVPPVRSRTLSSPTPGLWTAQVQAIDNRVTALDVRFPAAGERFQFVFPARASTR